MLFKITTCLNVERESDPLMFVPRGGEPVHTNHCIHLLVEAILIQKLKSSTTDEDIVSNTQ